MNAPSRKSYRITRDPDLDPPYCLVDNETDEIVRVGYVPRHLSEWALDNDAEEVKWDFDLKHPEEEERRRWTQKT